MTPVYSVPRPPAGRRCWELSTRYTLPGPLAGGNAYYVVVAGAANQTESTTPITNKPIIVPNAVVTFSPITGSSYSSSPRNPESPP